MKIKQKPLIRVVVEGNCPTMSLTQVRTRGHAFVVDEPPYRHGTDVGPTPLETMLGALVACTNVIARRIAHERNLRLHFRKIGCEGMLDHRGIDAEADVPVPFPDIRLTLEAETDATEAELASLKDALEQRCPMSVILRNAGSRISTDWQIVPMKEATS
jgi:putative redox protein